MADFSSYKIPSGSTYDWVATIDAWVDATELTRTNNDLLSSEVVAARDGETTLLGQINSIQANVGALQTWAEGASDFSQDNPVTAVQFSLTAMADTLSTETDIIAVFVYDTRLDSDGGAWRQRCSNTSWYNETLSTATRGAKQEFPAIAACIVETNRIVIYDLTEKDSPMWMIFTAGASLMTGGTSLSSISAKNGELWWGDSAADIHVARFIQDEGNRYGTAGIATEFLGTISDRNTANGFGGATTPNIVNRATNHIAIAVLDDAPINVATGLPIPTVWIATDGGVSRIAHDGTISSTTTTTVAVTQIATDGKTVLAIEADVFPVAISADSSLSGSGTILRTQWNKYLSGSGSTYPLILSVGAQFVVSTEALGASTGLMRTIVGLDGWSANTAPNVLIAYITKDYATPYLVGDVELCLAGDSLTDQSWESTTVSGTATYAVVASGASLQATTATSALTATVTTGGEAYGWEQVAGVWLFRRAIADFAGVAEATGTLTISNGTVFTRLVYTTSTPTESQLDAIESADRPLFAAGTDHLLAGTSNAILALGDDRATGELHVMTSWGRSTFKGLTLVASEATAVGTPISVASSDGVVVQCGSTGASADVPAQAVRDGIQRRGETTNDTVAPFYQYDSAVGVSDTDVWLGAGWRPVSVYWSASGNLSLVPLADYSVIHDGFRFGVRFGSAPGSGTVSILAQRMC